MKQLILWCVAYGLAILSAAWAAFYGVSEAATIYQAFLRGGTLAAVALVSVHGSSWAFRAWHNGHKGTAAFGSFVMVVCFVVTVAGGIGTLAGNVDQVGNERDKVADTSQDLRGERKRLLAQREGLPTHRPVTTVTAAIEAAKVDKRFGTSAGCDRAEITAKATREFCAALFALEAELATARSEEVIDARLAAIRDVIGGIAPQKSNNPQAAFIGRVTGLDAKQAEAWYAFGVSVAMELAGVFVMLMAEVMSRPRQRLETEAQASAEVPPASDLVSLSSAAALQISAAKPLGSVGKFLVDSLTPARGKKVRAAELFDVYQRWCRFNDRDPVDRSRFDPTVESIACKAMHLTTEQDAGELVILDAKAVV